MNHPTTGTVTAAALAIGDELLSGRTRDKNIGHLAEMLTAAGIDLEEVRIVPDDHQRIIKALNELRSSYDHVFTSGGIGPTHDDITADAVAAAFGVACEHDPDALALLGAHYAERGLEFTDARRRMARMPVGSRHIANPVSCAPGFIIGNVHVMAGVPSVFQAMLDNVLPTLRTGIKIHSEKVSCPYGEGDIGDPLSLIAKAHPDVNIGSYPRFSGTGFSTEIVIRGRDQATIGAARLDVEAMLVSVQAKRDAAAR